MTPQGRFAIPGLGGRRKSEKNYEILLLAAGSGITPILSMVQERLEHGRREDSVTLVYGNRESATIMFHDLLEEMKDRHMERFRLFHILSREQRDIDIFNGRIDAAKIGALVSAGVIAPDRLQAACICGPADMIDECSQALSGQGMDWARIASERFLAAPVSGKITVAASAGESSTMRAGKSGGGLTADSDSTKAGKLNAGRAGVSDPDGVGAQDDANCSVEIRSGGISRVIEMDPARQSVLSAGRDAGMELAYSCEAGMCCTCRCRLVEGRVEMATNYSLEQWEIDAGFILACQARPLTSRLKVDFDSV